MRAKSLSLPTNVIFLPERKASGIIKRSVLPLSRQSSVALSKLSGLRPPSCMVLPFFSIVHPNAARQSSVAKISFEYSIFAILLPSDNAPQISARCAIDFDGGAAIAPCAFDFFMVTVIITFRFRLVCQLPLNIRQNQGP